jgi:putative SOS response-associated peptidase YedK
MCGRFVFRNPYQELPELFGLDPPPDLRPRYNVAPSQAHPVAHRPDGGRLALAPMKWGFVPRWATEPSVRPINAMAETVASKPLFRVSFKARRCLVPADGYYEWQGPAGRKRATLYQLRGGHPFAFAGLWDRFTPPDGDPVETFAVVTCPANELAAEVHDRMPVLLTAEAFGPWLDPRTPPSDLSPLLAPFPAALMDAVRVGPAVNSPKNDGAECVEPA